MGMGDKAKHKTEESLGKAKEQLGDKTDDERLAGEGEREQSRANVKQAGDKVKDALKKKK